MRPLSLILALLFLLSASVLALETDTPKDLRGDEGVLMDIRPTGAIFLEEDRILVSDSANNQFHIFDSQGRRFRRLDFPRAIMAPWYNGLAPLEGASFLAVGSHYHEKNVVRFVFARSVLHRYTLQGEAFTGDSAEVNYDPDRALRRTGLLGEKVPDPMEIGGVAVDNKQKRLFFGLTRPFSEDGSVLVYEARLDDVMKKDLEFDFKDAKAKLVPETEPAVGQPFRLTDAVYVQGKGLLLLLASQSADGKRFGSNQIWILKGGFGPAKKLAGEICPGNYASGMAVREDSKGSYRVALTFDNNPELTGTPSRIVVLKGLKL